MKSSFGIRYSRPSRVITETKRGPKLANPTEGVAERYRVTGLDCLVPDRIMNAGDEIRHNLLQSETDANTNGTGDSTVSAVRLRLSNCIPIRTANTIK